MSKRFPQELQNLWRQPGIKAAFISENEPLLEEDCPNCGGLGLFSTFIATNGPFNNPSAKGVNHFADGKWWVGQTFTAPCPVCGGVNPEIRVPAQRVTA